MDLGQFIVMFLGGMIGVILMRFAANWFVELLNKYPGLEEQPLPSLVGLVLN